MSEIYLDEYANKPTRKIVTTNFPVYAGYHCIVIDKEVDIFAGFRKNPEAV